MPLNGFDGQITANEFWHRDFIKYEEPTRVYFD